MKVKTRFKEDGHFRTCRGLLGLSGPADFGFPGAVGSVVLAWPQNLSARQYEQDPRRPRMVNQYIQQLPINCPAGSAELRCIQMRCGPDPLLRRLSRHVVEAYQWVHSHPDLKGEALGSSCGPTTVGPERHASHGFPSSLVHHDKTSPGLRPLGDVLLQPDKT